MTCCIAGMHRTGTSMVAQLLHLCGLYLGPEADLVPPAPDNPEGFWENIHFVGVNELILRTLGGAWDRPPEFPPGWEGHPDLREMSLAATDLIERFAPHAPWGWKDPRNSLTLPFWLRLLPELRVVVCLRNPLEVARSLQARDRSPIGFGLRLWNDYYRRLLGDVPPARRVVTHYSAYFRDPAAELRRVVGALGLRVSAETIARAETTIGATLRHQQASVADLVRAGAAAETVALYHALAVEAGPLAPDRTAIDLVATPTPRARLAEGAPPVPENASS